VGLLRKTLGIATAVIPAFAASQGRVGAAARGLQTGLQIAAPFLARPATPGAPLALTANGGGVSPGTRAGAGIMTVAGPVVRIAGATIFALLTKVAIRLGLTRISLKAFMQLVRRLGPTAAGVATGLALDEVATLVLADAQRRRVRTRGIPARDVRTVRRAVRIVRRVRKLSAAFGLGVTGGRRRAPPRRGRGVGPVVIAQQQD